MTSPHTEADGSGPAAAQVAGSFCPLPYDLDPRVTLQYFQDGWCIVCLPPGCESSSGLATNETTIRTVMHFKNNTTSDRRVTAGELYAAACGDVDEITFDTRTGHRNLRVAFPRLLTTRDAITKLWREHTDALPALIAEWEVNRVEIARKQEEARAKRNAAMIRARALLYDALNDEQRETFEKNSYFDVVGSAGTHWRIGTLSYSGNVTWHREDGSSGGEFCGHCTTTREKEWLPTHDHNLAQLLHLRTDEVDWVNTAVLCDGGRPRPWWDAKVSREKAEEVAYEEKRRREYTPARPGCMTSGSVTISGYWTATATNNIINFVWPAN